MRVLAVGNLYPPHDQGGGYEIVWAAADAALRAAGHEVRVLTTVHREPGRPEDAIARELRWYWRDHAFPKLGLRETIELERHNHGVLTRHLEDFRPDVVAWWAMGGMSLSMLETVRTAGVPAVAFVHDDWLDYGRRADRWITRPRLVRRLVSGLPPEVDWPGAAHYAFVSRATRDHAWGCGVRTPSYSVVPSGIDPALIDPAPPRDWAGRLLYVGRLDRRKGLGTLVAALELLPEATLTVAGTGPDGELLAHERVTLLGNVARGDLAQIYAESDAVVFPVEWREPWGLVPLEAMGRGRPVVATGRGGSGEYLEHEGNALLFEGGDAAGLAAAVRRLEGDPALRARLRDAGLVTARQHTEAHFNAAVVGALESAAA